MSSLPKAEAADAKALPKVVQPKPSVLVNPTPLAGASGSSSSSSAAQILIPNIASKAKKTPHIHNLLGYGPGKLVTNWDPNQREENEDQAEILPQTMLRIKRDLKEFFTDPVPEVFLVPDTENICSSHAIVIGPRDTPYEGGFFYFFVKFPPDYPIKPPKVKLMTTGKETVRFNPNLYRNGKVCLSILGTWSGPGWSPANNLSSVLLSIQSLMNEKPYHNEPGFEENGGYKHPLAAKQRQPNQADPVEQYNAIIRHETLRVAVLDIVDDSRIPTALREKVIDSIRGKYAHYEKVITANMELQGKRMNDPFGEPRGNFDYQSLAKRLAKLKETHPPDEDPTKLGAPKEYNTIAAIHATSEEPNFPNANAKGVDAQAAIDDANYYLDEEGTSGEDEDEEEEAMDSD